MIVDYTQTVLYIPQCVPLVDPGGLVIPDQTVAWPCGLVRCCNQILC